MEPLPSQQHGAEVEVLIYRLLPIFNNKKTDVHQLLHSLNNNLQKFDMAIAAPQLVPSVPSSQAITGSCLLLISALEMDVSVGEEVVLTEEEVVLCCDVGYLYDLPIVTLREYTTVAVQK